MNELKFTGGVNNLVPLDLHINRDGISDTSSLSEQKTLYDDRTEQLCKFVRTVGGAVLKRSFVNFKIQVGLPTDDIQSHFDAIYWHEHVVVPNTING